jgi:hypothetical protein
MKSILLTGVCFITLSLLTFSQDHDLSCFIQNPKGIPRERVTDFKSATISVDINPYEKQVQGIVDFQFEVIRPVVDSFWLDAPNMQIHSVLLGHDSIDFRVDKKGVFIFPDSSLVWENKYQLLVNYVAKPKKGMYFVGWDSCFTNSTPKQVWTQGQGIDNRHWFPHFDDLSDKLITETIIRFKNGYEVLSNGKLATKTVDDSATTWHYQMEKPHSSYLTMIAIGNYGVDTVYSNSRVQIRNWYYRNRPEKVNSTYYKTAELMDFLESYTGVAYPWGDYAQVPVHNFLYGAMENTSATIFSDNFFVDSTEFLGRNYVYVNAHEMAHQWFGNLITSRSPEAHWIHEGFATYFHGLWQGEVFGKEAGDLLFETFKQQALVAGESNQLPISHAEAGSSRHYMKSATVLRMLRNEVGEDVFRKTLTYFLNKYAHQNVTSEDFLMAFQDVAGVSLNWFFEDWVHTGGEPEFRFSIMPNWEGQKGTFLRVEQTNVTDIGRKRIHLPIDVIDGTNSKEIRIFTESDTVVQLSSLKPSQIQAVSIDRERHVLMKEEYSNWQRDWMKHVIGNSDYHVLLQERSLEWLIERDELSQRKLLQLTFSQESDYMSAAYLRFIDDFKLDPAVVDLLQKDGWPLMKQTIVSKLKDQDTYLNDALLVLASDKNNDVVSAAMVTAGNKGWINSELMLILEARTVQYAALRLNYAQLLFIAGEHDLAKTELERLTAPEISVDVRISAFSILAQLEYESAELAYNYYEAITSFNRRLKNQSKKILKEYDEESVSKWSQLFGKEGCKLVFEDVF